MSHTETSNVGDHTNMPFKPIKRMARETLEGLQGRHPLRSGSHYEPFFIIGSGRSGNTLVRRLLFAHPEVYIPPETYVLGETITEYERSSFLEWKALCRNILAMFAFSQDAETFPTLNFRPLYLDLIRTSSDKRGYDYIINELFLFLGRQVKQNVKYWGDKTPMNTSSLDRIWSAFPNGKFIHIVRDSYDVVESYLNMGRYNTIEDAAYRWLKAVDDCEQFGKNIPEQYLTVYYEKLVREPELQAEAIYDFLSLEFTPDFLKPLDSVEIMGDLPIKPHYKDVNKEISTKNIGKGRKNLSQRDISKIAEITGKKRGELGYS